eukprot:Selendium_serpulae@DN4531_c0_g1_i1.p1
MAHRGPPEGDREVYESIPESMAYGQAADMGDTVPARGYGSRPRYNEDIEDESHEANVAYEFFKGKNFQEMDYGDPIGTNSRDFKGRSEYEVLPGARGGRASGRDASVARSTTMRHMDSLAAGSRYQNFETPVQRLSRLQGEVEEMQEIVQNFLKSREVEEQDEAGKQNMLKEAKRYFEADPTKLFAELGSLQKQIEGVLSDERLQSFFTTSDAPTGRKSQYDAVVKHLNDVTTTLGKASEQPKPSTKLAGAGTGSTDQSFSYELYCVPSMKPLVEGSRLSALEKRLNDLESHVGVNMRRQITMPFEDLNAGLSEVAARLVQLDSNRLDALTQRMTKLNGELDALQRRRERLNAGTGTGVEDQHVQQLYEMSDRWRHAIAALPMVIRRLRTLKALHQESASISTRLNVLEAQQNDLAKLLETTAVNFDTLRDNIANNMKWAKTMVEELQEKMTAVNVTPPA